MPLEIKELHIKVSVNQPGQGAQPAPASPQNLAADKQQMIAECVEQAIQVMKSKKER
ncbi:MAG TPA: DUF5908 family protein [Chitinophagaceae bacterium]|nr:DUF5908 family protein [Chitinophagaceae bacterium]